MRCMNTLIPILVALTACGDDPQHAGEPPLEASYTWADETLELAASGDWSGGEATIDVARFGPESCASTQLFVDGLADGGQATSVSIVLGGASDELIAHARAAVAAAPPANTLVGRAWQDALVDVVFHPAADQVLDNASGDADYRFKCGGVYPLPSDCENWCEGPEMNMCFATWECDGGTSTCECRHCGITN